jgi:hypothetical protein
MPSKTQRPVVSSAKAMRTNSNKRKAKVVASGTCALCGQSPTFSVVRSKRVKATEGYTLYCKKHADRKVAIRAARAAKNAAGKKATPKAAAKGKKATGKAKASSAKGNANARRRAAAAEALAS